MLLTLGLWPCTHAITTGHNQVAHGIHEVIAFLHYLAVFVALVQPKLTQPVPQGTKNFQLASTHQLPALVDPGFHGIVGFLQVQTTFPVDIYERLPIDLTSTTRRSYRSGKILVRTCLVTTNEALGISWANSVDLSASRSRRRQRLRPRICQRELGPLEA
jgi:hypothetical protein